MQEKVTLGITALLKLRVLIDILDCDLDVELKILYGAVLLKDSLFDYKIFT